MFAPKGTLNTSRVKRRSQKPGPISSAERPMQDWSGPSKIVWRPDEGAECRKALRSVESVLVSGTVNGDGSLTVVQAVCESNPKVFF